MKVLMFGWELPPFNAGGLGVACHGLVKSLTSKGVEVTFVLPKRIDLGNEPFKVIFADIPDLTGIGINSLLLPYSTSQSYSSLRSKLSSDIYGGTLFDEVERYGLEARRISKKIPHDVIHAHDWLSLGAGLMAREISGKPLIAHIHATEIDRSTGNVNPLIYDREREGLEKADRVAAVSQYTKDKLVNHYGISSDKIDVIHNGINPENYYIHEVEDKGLMELKKAGYKVVIFVGRITIMKGPDYFLRAAKKVLEYNPKTIFVIVGTGDMEGQIMRQAANLKISRNVIFAGFLRGVELSRVYKAADLYVLPSVSEPFGLTPLESQLHGTPVLISKQSGVSEVLNHVLKVDFWDTDDMADKILSVVNHVSLKNTLRTNGVREAFDCNWDSAADKCINIYNNLL